MNLAHNAWAHVHAGWAVQHGATSLIKASENGHVEAVRVLIEKGALIEAADKVRIRSHAITYVRSQSLIHTHTCRHWAANALSSLVSWLCVFIAT